MFNFHFFLNVKSTDYSPKLADHWAWIQIHKINFNSVDYSNALIAGAYTKTRYLFKWVNIVMIYDAN